MTGRNESTVNYIIYTFAYYKVHTKKTRYRMKKQSIYRSCPNCHGEGVISHLDQFDNIISQDCTECKGTGKIRKIEVGERHFKKTLL